MKSRIVIDGNSFYEIDEDCMRRQREQKKEQQIKRQGEQWRWQQRKKPAEQ